jgi:hypothetical protein
MKNTNWLQSTPTWTRAVAILIAAIATATGIIYFLDQSQKTSKSLKPTTPVAENTQPDPTLTENPLNPEQTPLNNNSNLNKLPNPTNPQAPTAAPNNNTQIPTTPGNNQVANNPNAPTINNTQTGTVPNGNTKVNPSLANRQINPNSTPNINSNTSRQQIAINPGGMTMNNPNPSFSSVQVPPTNPKPTQQNQTKTKFNSRLNQTNINTSKIGVSSNINSLDQIALNNNNTYTTPSLPPLQVEPLPTNNFSKNSNTKPQAKFQTKKTIKPTETAFNSLGKNNNLPILNDNPSVQIPVQETNLPSANILALNPTTLPNIVPPQTNITPPPITLDQQAKTNSNLTIPQVAEAREYLQSKWKPPANLKQTIQYTVVLNDNGEIEKIEPLGETAVKLATSDNSPFPKPGEKFVSPSMTVKNPQIRVFLEPDGKVQTFLQSQEE